MKEEFFNIDLDEFEEVEVYSVDRIERDFLESQELKE